ncbi:hypothetical protein [Actinomycetospora sp. NBC_00405]|uniref:hypothetical protein n=1 Tax=Actinomycetospora sp. NBC_00405 TaxID=2975952 RepID=UPI002E1F867C
MLKKMGVVTVGVAAGLMVAAPFASAHESGHDSDHGSDHGSRGSDSSDCNVTGGSAEANGGIEGDALAGNLLAQAPVGGANALNIVCNDILNGNASGNNVAVDIAGLPGAPELPELPIELPEVPTS